jgi:hypothetical protein
VNTCPNPKFRDIKCPYALSENSPLPCCATFKQCEDVSKYISECEKFRVDPFNPSCPDFSITQVEEKIESKIVNNPLYGLEVNLSVD